MTEASQAKTIFVVEDDDQFAFLLGYLLEREGYGVITATDGQKAHELISENAAPDLVLLDLMLPFIDGFDLVKHIRDREGWSDVPVIMLSGRAEENDIVKALDAGANDYMIKPFQPGELLARVRRFI